MACLECVFNRPLNGLMECSIACPMTWLSGILVARSMVLLSGMLNGMLNDMLNGMHNGFVVRDS